MSIIKMDWKSCPLRSDAEFQLKLKGLERKKILSMTQEEREKLLAYINHCDVIYKVYSEEIRESLKAAF